MGMRREPHILLSSLVSARMRSSMMTRECDERMWHLAYRLARSGENQNYNAIEWELQASGFPRSRLLLNCERVREKLGGICAEAQKKSLFSGGLSWLRKIGRRF